MSSWPQGRQHAAHGHHTAQPSGHAAALRTSSPSTNIRLLEQPSKERHAKREHEGEIQWRLSHTSNMSYAPQHLFWCEPQLVNRGTRLNQGFSAFRSPQGGTSNDCSATRSSLRENITARSKNPLMLSHLHIPKVTKKNNNWWTQCWRTSAFESTKGGQSSFVPGVEISSMPPQK